MSVSPAGLPPFRLLRSRRKSVGLSVDKNGLLTVRAPLRLAQAKIETLVTQKLAWIEKARAKMLAQPQPEKTISRILQSGAPLLGQLIPLQRVEGEKPQLIWEDGQLQVTSSGVKHLATLLPLWYRARAAEIIPARVHALAAQSGLQPASVRITSARTRWGSCSAKNNLSFTWRLMMGPPEALDYVIWHELAHIRVKNHSEQFWQLVQSLMPDYKQQLAWLKAHGRELDV